MQKIRRILLTFFLSILVLSSVFSTSLHDAYYTLFEPVQTLIASVSAAYFNIPQVALPGVAVIDGTGVIPREIHFKDSDVGLYKNSLTKPKSDNAFLSFLSMAVNSVSPLVSNAVTILDRMAPSTGDFIVNGSLYISGGDTITLTDILNMKFISNINMKVNCKLNLSGKSFPNGVTLDGVIEIVSQADGTFIVQPVNFKLNGELLEEGYIKYGSPSN